MIKSTLFSCTVELPLLRIMHKKAGTLERTCYYVHLAYALPYILVGYEGLDKWLRRRAPGLKVHGSNPAMTWLKITSLAVKLALQALT